MSTVEELAALVLAQTQERRRAEFPDWLPSWPDDFDRDAYLEQMIANIVVRVVPGRVYTKVDVGDGSSMSGKYMIENATGTIFGIKAYGKVHKGHRYGTLDTIDEWYWGGYAAVPAWGPRITR